MSVCPYEHWDLGNYKSYNTGNRHSDSWDSCAAQVRFAMCHAHSNAHKPSWASYAAQVCCRFLRFLRCASLFQKCHAHSNTHKPPLSIPIDWPKKQFNTYRLTQKKVTPTLTPTNRPILSSDPKKKLPVIKAS